MFKLPSAYFERLLESSLDIVIAADHRGQIIFYNDGASKTLGYTSEEVRGKRLAVYPSLAEARRVMDAMRSEEIGMRHRSRMTPWRRTLRHAAG